MANLLCYITRKKGGFLNACHDEITSFSPSTKSTKQYQKVLNACHDEIALFSPTTKYQTLPGAKNLLGTPAVESAVASLSSLPRAFLQQAYCPTRQPSWQIRYRFWS